MKVLQVVTYSKWLINVTCMNEGIFRTTGCYE